MFQFPEFQSQPHNYFILHLGIILFLQEAERLRQREDEEKRKFERWKEEERAKFHTEMEELRQLFLTEIKDFSNKNSVLEGVRKRYGLQFSYFLEYSTCLPSLIQHGHIIHQRDKKSNSQKNVGKQSSLHHMIYFQMP